MEPNGTKWYQMVPNGAKQKQMESNEAKWSQTEANGVKWSQMGPRGDKWSLCFGDTALFYKIVIAFACGHRTMNRIHLVLLTLIQDQVHAYPLLYQGLKYRQGLL